MTANPRQELHQLVERLSDEGVAALLADARWLVARRRGHALPTLHAAPPITSIDELRAEVFPPDENVDAFDATIRRWREEGSSFGVISRQSTG